MASEDLEKDGYLPDGRLHGSAFGNFELLNIGAVALGALAGHGMTQITMTPPAFTFAHYKAPRRPTDAKPDQLYGVRTDDGWEPRAVVEHKRRGKFRRDSEVVKAGEQALYTALVLNLSVAVITDSETTRYVDVAGSVADDEVRFLTEHRDFTPAVLEELLRPDPGRVRDPGELVEGVWQSIWHATKAEPKECLMTFVEIFVLKFLSDNLSAKLLPRDKSFAALTVSPDEFAANHGTTAIEHYVSVIRPHIKTLFPDNERAVDQRIPALFGLGSVVSKTSVINGFAFLRSSEQSVAHYNRTFLEILAHFERFGPLTNIDPEFKLRLYETFLKRSARQQKLGQFLTPRNIVKPMVRMAELSKLPDGAVVLDPAAGVGGFVLEPLLWDNALAGNITFANGHARRRVLTVGVDVDANMHILAKANVLLHLAEEVRDERTTMGALRELMAETFVLFNENETLGSLERPPREAVDVILTNPPYVTQGSAIYRREVANVTGERNGLELKTYYDGCGLGLEAYFMRYISGALKPGGRAYVIVPIGLLTRTEPGAKRGLLRECNLLASIALPRNAFFNTPQETYIIVLERRHTEVDERPPVLCGIARSIGETLDAYRLPDPDNNELDNIASLFIELTNTGRIDALNELPSVRLVAGDEFGPDDRWDVQRFWADDELVAIGERQPAVEPLDFLAEMHQELTDIKNEVEVVVADLARVETSAANADNGQMSDDAMTFMTLADPTFVRLKQGDPIRYAGVQAFSGEVPVFSSSKDPRKAIAHVNEGWLTSEGFHIYDTPFVTVNRTGSVGFPIARRGKCALSESVIAVLPQRPDIDVDYLAVALGRVIAAGDYHYGAKLPAGRLRRLSIPMPVLEDGTFDVERQRRIAASTHRFGQLRSRLVEMGRRAQTARIG